MPYADPTRKKYIPTSDVILEKADRAFIEPWSKREKKRAENKSFMELERPLSPITGKVMQPRPTKGGVMIDKAFKAKVKRMYKSGLSIRRMAHEMQCSTTTIQRLRREDGYETRTNAKGKGEQWPTNINVNVTHEMVVAIRKRVFGKYRTRSDYVRELIRRDCGL